MRDPKAWIGMGGAVALLAGVVWLGLRSAEEAPPGLTLEERYQLDDRIDPLIFDCPFKRTFDAQVADMVPLWVSKLEHGTKEPLRQAKKELGLAGPAAMAELERLWDQVNGSAEGRWQVGVLENILQACNNMQGPEALGLIRRAMEHGTGSVRLAALPYLAAHGDASDYDRVAIWLGYVGTGEIKSEYIETLGALDKDRYLRDALEWFTIGQHPDLWPFLALDVAKSRDPELAPRFKATAPLRDDQYVPFLMAPAAALGDGDAMQELLTRLAHERPGARQYAVQALAAMGATEPLMPLVADEHAGVRRLVVTALVDDESEACTEYLRDATKDTDRSIAETAIQELVRRGDELVVAQTLELLEGSILDRNLAIDALRRAWDVNPEAADRAFARLMTVWQRDDQDPRVRMSVLESLAHVPRIEAAEFLLDFGRQYEGQIKGRSAHRLVCGMLWNTGEVGREILREQLKVETDPFRRLDLIEFIWQDHADVSRDALLEVLLDGSRSGYERLYAGDRLIRVGPASLVAPALKRVYLENTDQVIRPAMQCLLWTWYGQHDFQ